MSDKDKDLAQLITEAERAWRNAEWCDWTDSERSALIDELEKQRAAAYAVIHERPITNTHSHTEALVKYGMTSAQIGWHNYNNLKALW